MATPLTSFLAKTTINFSQPNGAALSDLAATLSQVIKTQLKLSTADFANMHLAVDRLTIAASASNTTVLTGGLTNVNKEAFTPTAVLLVLLLPDDGATEASSVKVDNAVTHAFDNLHGTVAKGDRLEKTYKAGLALVAATNDTLKITNLDSSNAAHVTRVLLCRGA